MKSMMCCAAIVAFAGVANASTVTQFRLGDHPDGSQNPPPYGLRFDGLFGGHSVATFSMDHFADTTLTVTDNGGNINMHIVGTLYGGLVDGAGGYVSPDIYYLDFSYTVNVQAQTNGWIAFGEHAGDAGSLIRDHAGSPSTNPADFFALETKAQTSGEAFFFLADGHRLPDNDSWVGWGWFQPRNSDGGSQDFLFTADLIPAPASACLLAFGGLMSARRRRA